MLSRHALLLLHFIVLRPPNHTRVGQPQAAGTEVGTTADVRSQRDWQQCRC